MPVIETEAYAFQLTIMTVTPLLPVILKSCALLGGPWSKSQQRRPRFMAAAVIGCGRHVTRT